MKKLSLILFASFLLFACKSEPQKSDRNIVIGDTITTKSGLKYVFLKEGKGRKIKAKSKVKIYTDLYVNNADTTIWTTSKSKDSSFAFIHQKSPLIKGFTEVHNYLAEGDEIIAILPDSLAYGKNGRGSVPPKATLIYRPLVVKYVSQPKESLIDTLVSISKKENVSAAISYYEKALSNKLTNEYHTDLEDVVDILNEFKKDSSYVKIKTFSKYFLSKNNDDKNLEQTLYYHYANSLEQQGKIKEAIDIVEPLSKQKLNQQYWANALKILKEQLKK